MEILVLGKNGMAGSMVCHHLSKFHSVTGWSRNDFDPLLQEIPNLNKYDRIINCIGIIKQKTDVSDDAMFKINSEFPHVLADACRGRLIHISSDCVFSGKLPHNQSYNSFDTKDAEDTYGKSKAMGEPINNALVIRTSIIGPAKEPYGLFEWFRATNQNPVMGFVNHFWSGITTLELAKIINDKLNSGPELLQVASPQISKFDLLNYINKTFCLNKNIKQHYDKININRTLVTMIPIKSISEQLKELIEG